MSAKYSVGAGKMFTVSFLAMFELVLGCFFWAVLRGWDWEIFKFCLGQVSSGFKKANLVSMSEATTENDKNVSTETVAAMFENEIGSEEVSGERAWRNYGYFDARKSDYSKANTKLFFWDHRYSIVIGLWLKLERLKAIFQIFIFSSLPLPTGLRILINIWIMDWIGENKKHVPSRKFKVFYWIFVSEIHCKLPDEICCLISKKNGALWSISFFNGFRKVLPHFESQQKVYVCNDFSKRILNFDTDYFDFLQSELRFLGKEIRKKFEERIVRNIFVFSLIDNHVEKTVYDLLPFWIFCHCFFCVRGSKTAGKCDVCSRFFVDDSYISSKIDQEFLLSKNSIQHLPICELMKQVNARSVVLNLYYLVGEYAGNSKMTENFGETFFEIANNPFGAYIFYLQIYLRMLFNLLKPVTKKVVDNYLAEHCSSKQTVSKIRKRLKKHAHFLLPWNGWKIDEILKFSFVQRGIWMDFLYL